MWPEAQHLQSLKFFLALCPRVPEGSSTLSALRFLIMGTSLHRSFLTLLTYPRNPRPPACELKCVCSVTSTAVQAVLCWGHYRHTCYHSASISAADREGSAFSSAFSNTHFFVFHKFLKRLQEGLFASLQPVLSLFIRCFKENGIVQLHKRRWSRNKCSRKPLCPILLLSSPSSVPL